MWRHFTSRAHTPYVLVLLCTICVLMSWYCQGSQTCVCMLLVCSPGTPMGTVMKAVAARWTEHKKSMATVDTTPCPAVRAPGAATTGTPALGAGRGSPRSPARAYSRAAGMQRLELDALSPVHAAGADPCHAARQMSLAGVAQGVQLGVLGRSEREVEGCAPKVGMQMVSSRKPVHRTPVLLPGMRPGAGGEGAVAAVGEARVRKLVLDVSSDDASP